MKKLSIVLLSIMISSYCSFGQANLLNVKSKKFKTSRGLKIEGQVGFLEVPENRKNPSSRKIKLKYVHLKSLSKKPATPVIYLEGGGGVGTTEAYNPKFLDDRMEYLEVADFIFIDRRGASDKQLTYIWKEGYPTNFFVSEENANQHYQEVAKVALKRFQEKNIDISGYNIEEHAHDVNDLMSALGFDRYTLFGFSFGSHIGMTVMELFSDQVERAIFVGADAPNQSFNFPSHLDEHVKKIGTLIEQEGTLKMNAQDFSNLVNKTLQKVKENPVTVTVRNPLNLKKTDLSIGAFGLALILRLDIDDSYDVPVIPRLLHSINNGDYSMLTWFVQKRMTLALGLPGQGINQQLASKASPERWSTIEKESSKSVFGNVVNFPFSAVKDHWPKTDLSFDPTIPMKTDIPTLFISGKLDCRTPVQQTEEIMKGFTNAAHVQVENAGHEQAQWNGDVVNSIIPSFMGGEPVESTTVFYSNIKFIPLTGEASGHPSMK
ncbi:MAG: alpha/beta hydrolase [Roseivirga sp.]|nr:alpha/beta hydrolase [Roseivirga sp.]